MGRPSGTVAAGIRTARPKRQRRTGDRPLFAAKRPRGACPRAGGEIRAGSMVSDDRDRSRSMPLAAGNGSLAICFPTGGGLARLDMPAAMAAASIPGELHPTGPRRPSKCPCPAKSADTQPEYRHRPRRRLGQAGSAAAKPVQRCYRHEPCRPGIRAPVSHHILSRAASRDDEDACPHRPRQTDPPHSAPSGAGICREGVSLSRSGLPLAAAGRARRLQDTPARCPRRRAASAVRRRGRDRPLSTTSIR